MTIEELERKLKSNELNSIYVLYGEETFLLYSCLKKIKNAFGELVKGINYIEIDDTNVNNLIQDIETPAFGYEKKLIIVKNTELFKREVKKKGKDFLSLRDRLQEYLKENIEIIKDTVILVFVEETVDKTKMLATLEECDAVICNFEYQKLPSIIARLKAICNAYKVNIDDSTLKYFIECVRSKYAGINKRDKKTN